MNYLEACINKDITLNEFYKKLRKNNIGDFALIYEREQVKLIAVENILKDKPAVCMASALSRHKESNLFYTPKDMLDEDISLRKVLSKNDLCKILGLCNSDLENKEY